MIYRLILVVLALFPCTAHAQAQNDDVKLIVRAFIPNAVTDNPGYVFSMQNTDGKPVFVIRGPAPLGDTCFLGDQRDFVLKEGQSARIWATATAPLSFGSTATALAAKDGDTGRTHAIRCADSSFVCDDKASSNQIGWNGFADSPSTLSVQVAAKASNPCVKLAGVPIPAPGIDITGAFSFNKLTGTLEFTGSASKFPSIEVFALYHGRAWPLVEAGAIGNVFNIGEQRALSGKTALPIFEGKWHTVDPASRFMLTVTGDDFELVERSGATTLTRTGKLRIGPTGLPTVYRENDTATLQFLGFSSAIIAEIQARNPQPSYITIKRSALGIDANWAGLLVIKDANGKFKEMKQPGQGPIKPYPMQQ